MAIRMRVAPESTDYRPLFTTQDEWTIVKYVMEVSTPFQYWTLCMSTRHTVTLHYIITVYNDKFNHMDGVMRALAKEKTPWKEDLFFAVKLAQQKLSRYYAEVTPTTGISFPHISPILFGSCDCSETGTREWLLILRTRHPPKPNSKSPF